MTFELTRKGRVLVLNCGSSSVKFALYSVGADMEPAWSGAAERIGLRGGRFHANDANGVTLFDESVNIDDHAAALTLLLDAIEKLESWEALVAVGHRVAHGGPRCDCPMVVDAALEELLQELIPLAPLHLPHNLAGMRAVSLRRPDLPQVACFDTAFHHGLPRVAQMTGLPRQLEGANIRRYGFHGLSYEYILGKLQLDAGIAAAQGRLIVAHLGNGASMAAIRDGRSIETTMGFSALDGLLMGTRCGDLDPGIILHLLKDEAMTVESIEHLLYKASGLLGVSGVSRNMRDLLARKQGPQVAEAIELYCYRARKHLAALTASLGGLDRLVFTGGIGANAAEIRASICNGLAYLGISLDPVLNRSGELTISADASPVTVQVFATDEELMIARHTLRTVMDPVGVREMYAHEASA